MKTVDVIVTYLDMHSAADLRRPQRPVDDLVVQRVAEPAPEYAHFLYTTVGSDWHWTDRLGWSYADWQAHGARLDVETWVGYVGGAPCGYFELERTPAREVEIQYFGLLRGFIGRGLGGHLLAAAIERAWSSGPRRVWVHTCTLDGPAALANYEARGFRVYKRETVRQPIADVPRGPWPGAFDAASIEDRVA